MSNKPLVLVLEDEYFLKADLEQTLNEAGFATETASSGEEALAIFLGDTKKFKVLVTDVRLQGSTLCGWEVARQFREKEPALPVIYVTGSTSEEWPSNGLPNSILIQKPFARAQLITATSSLLNIRTPATIMAETTALLRSVLNEVCEQVGRYENGTRAHVASKLLEAATRGEQTVEELKQAGQIALRNAPR